MQLIVLTGLVAVEKAELARELAQHHETMGLQVALIDNIARLQMDHVALQNSSYQRLQGDITHYLAAILAHTVADVTILAASEMASPDALFGALASLDEVQPGIGLHSITLIDTRTCDCFPAVRERLEQHADQVVMLPYTLADVLAGLPAEVAS